MDIVINAKIAALPDGSVSIPTQGNYYHTLLTCLDYPDDHPPVADLLRKYHGLEGQWLIVSPIHWQATHNDAMIIAEGPELQLSEEESRRWFEAFAEYVASENRKAFYHNAYTWLLQYDGKPTLLAKPVHRLLHQSMMPELAVLDKTLYWQRLITETQMFFSAHPLNKARTGSYPINGVWFWGQGTLHAPVQKPLLCQSKDLQRLAQILSINVSEYNALPVSKDSVLLFNELSDGDLQALQISAQKNTAYWHWNNLAYISKPKSWLTRLKEKIR